MEMIQRKGALHPITATITTLTEVFNSFGYTLALGPELEDEYHNFDALNIPADHPAREMQDTFWIKDRPGFVLRTHTSPMQIRYMEQHAPPIRIVVPGKVFRNEATDATHEAQFHQLEGLCVSEDATLASLKGIIEAVLRHLFGDFVSVRYRPSFFPFTEPSLEVDMKLKEGGEWIEVLGCGMVHRQILSRVGIDCRRYSGFAFGMGIDRIVMLRHHLDDVRLLYKGDLQVVSQFLL